MSWALIAGGSKGIGFSIAQSLASRKYNLALVARDSTDLSAAKYILEKNYNIQTAILVCDLSLTESADTIYAWCVKEGFDINILCNAAGMGGSKDFSALPLKDLRVMLRTNLESAVILSSTIIPLLKKHSPSYILNIGSLAGFAPIPSKAIYSSTKSAIHFFSYSLKQLLKSENISVSCLCPGPVFTKPSIKEETISQLGWFGNRMAVDADLVGELAVRGMFKQKMFIIPGKFASLISLLLRILPNRLLSRLFFAHQNKTSAYSKH